MTMLLAMALFVPSMAEIETTGEDRASQIYVDQGGARWWPSEPVGEGGSDYYVLIDDLDQPSSEPVRFWRLQINRIDTSEYHSVKIQTEVSCRGRTIRDLFFVAYDEMGMSIAGGPGTRPASPIVPGTRSQGYIEIFCDSSADGME